MSEIVEKKPNIEANDKVIRGHSFFPLNYKFANTLRFGEYSPHFVMECVNNDKINLRCGHNIRSYTLKSPLMSDIQIKKDYFNVPMEAILPMNWDKIYTAPVIGDDITPQDVNCILRGDSIREFILNYKTWRNLYYSSADPNYDYLATLDLKVILMLESIFSKGSLASSLGMHLSGLIHADVDKVLEDILSYLVTQDDQIVVTWGSSSLPVIYSNDNTEGRSFRDFLSRARDDYDWKIANDYDKESYDEYFKTNDVNNFWTSLVLDDTGQRFNLARLFAYQIVCAHYYTNDKVDYVYSAELYRQNLFDAFKKIDEDLGGTASNNTFEYNGLSVRYDSCSGRYINFYLNSSWLSTWSELSIMNFATNIGNFLSLIFSYKRSLRFVDYFTGSKTQPLAVGDINATVSNNKVNAVDITRNIQRQRFFNFVNRTGRRFEEYVSKLGGKYVAPDYHNPLFLSGTSDLIFGSEVENTGSAQLTNNNSVTTTLRSNASKYAFEIEVDRPSILIGITYFDIPRYYAWNIEKQNMHINRFDMFNPFMQFIGDQEVLQVERDSRKDVLGTFGYNLRHQEYKTRVNMVSGAFVDNYLPHWEFVADRVYNPISGGQVIGPNYIRSSQTELDEFYQSLSGYSLAHYFHFIVVNDNKCDATRPMVKSPSIL